MTNTQQPIGWEQHIEGMLDLPEGGARELAYETGSEIATMAIEAGAKIILGPLADAVLFCAKVRQVYSKAKENALKRLELLTKEKRIAFGNIIISAVHQEGYRVTPAMQPVINKYLGIEAPMTEVQAQAQPTAAEQRLLAELAAAEQQFTAEEQAFQAVAATMEQQEIIAAAQEQQLKDMVRGMSAEQLRQPSADAQSVMEGHKHMAEVLKSTSAPIEATKNTIATVGSQTADAVHTTLADLPALPADVADAPVRDPLTDGGSHAADVVPAAPADPEIIPYLEKTRQWSIESCARFLSIVDIDPEYAPYLDQIRVLLGHLKVVDAAWFQSHSWMSELRAIPGLAQCNGFDHWIQSGGRIFPDAIAEGAMGVPVDFLAITKHANVDMCKRWMDVFGPRVDQADRDRLIGLIEAQDPEWFRTNDWTALLSQIPSMSEVRLNSDDESIVLHEMGLYRRLLDSGFSRFTLTPERAQECMRIIREYTRQFGRGYDVVAADRNPITYILRQAIHRSRQGTTDNRRYAYDASVKLARDLGIR